MTQGPTVISFPFDWLVSDSNPDRNVYWGVSFPTVLNVKKKTNAIDNPLKIYTLI